MPGVFDIGNVRPALADFAAPIGVYRFDGAAFQFLPNVRCIQIDYREGPDPPTARFVYITDDALFATFGWPARVGQLWPLNAFGPYVVSPDDRLIVATIAPGGTLVYLFDGFAQIPQADLTPQSEGVTFAAIGVAARAFDETIVGRVQRDGDDPQATMGDDEVFVRLPCRFNPADQSVGSDGQFLGNMTGRQYFTTDAFNSQIIGGTGLGDFPVFIDPLVRQSEVTFEKPPDTWVTQWSVSDAVKYLLSQPYIADDYITWPDFAALDNILSAMYPPAGGDIFNPANAESSNILIRDYDATHKTLPDVLNDLLGYAGFVMNWELSRGADGLPETFLRIARRDAAAANTPKQVWLDQVGTTLNLARNNVGVIHLARDSNVIVNAWRVETALKQIEICVMLAPLYEPVSGDYTGPARKQFFRDALATATAEIQRRYRWYGADECGDGFWDAQLESWLTGNQLYLGDLFPPDPVTNARTWCARYRPGSRTLISTDSKGKPRRAKLEIYLGNKATSPAPISSKSPAIVMGPAPEDGWFEVTNGWRLLEDRLGIEVTVNDPEDWQTGNKLAPHIRGIRWWSNPNLSGNPNGTFSPPLRLTTVIEADEGISIKAPKRTASPTRFTRQRSADAADHFGHCEVDPGSLNYFRQTWPDPANAGLMRNDKDRAQAHCNQLRASHEFPPLAGIVVIPYITNAYQIGDRIDQISGRGISLQTNIGVDQGESPAYPWVVGVSWSFEPDRQQTILHLSDRRGEIRNAW